MDTGKVQHFCKKHVRDIFKAELENVVKYGRAIYVQRLK